MNKIEANVSLFAITFFGAVQYIFLADIPEDLSSFAFLSITNFLGFLMTLAFFFGELFRLDAHQIIQSIVLSGELVLFNFFMLLGVNGVDPGVTSAVLSSFFVFILIFETVFNHKKPDKFSVISVISVLTGLFFMTNADIESLMNIKILYFVIADVFLAFYVMTVGSYASSSNPSILAMGQMFFCCIFSLILWIAEAVLTNVPFQLPLNREFWVGVIYISFFIRGLYSIIQIYAQRYVSPLNTSLIFSSEIVMTMLVSSILSNLFGLPSENITLLKLAGSVLIILGIVIMEPDSLKYLRRIKNLKIFPKFNARKASKNIITRQKVIVIILSAFVYILFDAAVDLTGFLPVYSGIKNSLPFITGLFFGLYGTLGNLIGSVISSLLTNEAADTILAEIWCVFISGTCVYYGWHILSKSHRIHFKHLKHYLRYIFLVALVSVLCIKPEYMMTYFLTGIIIGLPVNILFGSLLYIEPIVPIWCELKSDAAFELENSTDSLEKVNDILQDTAVQKNINMKKIFEIQSCLEELSIRIFNAIPDAKIQIKVIYYNAISMRLFYSGEKYNPFRINKNEDVLDIMSLKIIKHRALRASFAFYKGENKIHVVM